MAWSLSGQRVARVREGGIERVQTPVKSSGTDERRASAPTPATPTEKVEDTGPKPTDRPSAAETKQDAGLPQASPPAIVAGPHKVNLNTATQAELELLPGIGPAMAKRILDYRKDHGKFASVEQLDNVRGVGAKTMERLRALVTVE
jgi:competence protein ComEA